MRLLSIIGVASHFSLMPLTLPVFSHCHVFCINLSTTIAFLIGQRREINFSFLYFVLSLVNLCAKLMSCLKAENPNFWGFKKQLSSYASSACWQWNSFQFRGIDLYFPISLGSEISCQRHTHTDTHMVWNLYIDRSGCSPFCISCVLQPPYVQPLKQAWFTAKQSRACKT